MVNRYWQKKREACKEGLGVCGIGVNSQEQIRGASITMVGRGRFKMVKVRTLRGFSGGTTNAGG